MSTCFLDTNILLRYLTEDNQQMARRAFDLLTRIERGEDKVITSPLVIFEAVFTLQSFYKVPRREILRAASAYHLPTRYSTSRKSVFYKAFDLYVNQNISFADAYNAAYMMSEEIPNIYSWDKDFDKIDGIVKIEP